MDMTSNKSQNFPQEARGLSPGRNAPLTATI
nr:MAG TPA: hypothetical protein [Caudoviricetes sp.]